MSDVLSVSDVLSAQGVAVSFDDLMRLQHLGWAARRRPPGRLTALPGGVVGKRRGRGLEVHDVRPWQYGDEVRHTDHNATARTGAPFTRTFRDEREATLLLVADYRPSMLFGTRRVFRSVAAAHVLALEGWRAIAEGGRVGVTVLMPGEVRSIAPSRGTRGLINALALLARAHADALADPGVVDSPLDAALEAAARLVPREASIVAATALDEPGSSFAVLLPWLSRRNDLRFVLLRDAFERAPPPGTYPFVTAGGARGSLRIDARTTAVDGRDAVLRQLGARVVSLDTDATLESYARAVEVLHG